MAAIERRMIVEHEKAFAETACLQINGRGTRHGHPVGRIVAQFELRLIVRAREAAEKDGRVSGPMLVELCARKLGDGAIFFKSRNQDAQAVHRAQVRVASNCWMTSV